MTRSPLAPDGAPTVATPPTGSTAPAIVALPSLALPPAVPRRPPAPRAPATSVAPGETGGGSAPATTGPATPAPSPAGAPRLGAEAVVGLLRAAGEPTRFRILRLVAAGDLTVKDLTTILGQSQPRISRHLKVLVESGLVERFPEGAWAYYRPSEGVGATALAAALAALVDAADVDLARDARRLAELRHAHAEEAARFFASHARDWDRIRSLQVDDGEVEAAIVAAVGDAPIEAYLDLGTGTGRMLELLAGRYRAGLGVDLSHDMLAAARAALAERGVVAQLRHGDLYALNLPAARFDLVTLHQVLHYLDEPTRALREAARVLKPGGRLLVVDFAPHGLEFLRDEQAHRRLGFSHAEMARSFVQAGLTLTAVRDLPPGAGPAAAGLTVTLWLGQAGPGALSPSSSASEATS
jgi:ubiquinone/menaquinone biosynthesis C-methylase UbiE/DNA-binding HxlR family transcriptional regulator